MGTALVQAHAPVLTLLFWVKEFWKTPLCKSRPWIWDSILAHREAFIPSICNNSASKKFDDVFKLLFDTLSFDNVGFKFVEVEDLLVVFVKFEVESMLGEFLFGVSSFFENVLLLFILAALVFIPSLWWYSLLSSFDPDNLFLGNDPTLFFSEFIFVDFGTGPLDTPVPLKTPHIILEWDIRSVLGEYSLATLLGDWDCEPIETLLSESPL